MTAANADAIRRRIIAHRRVKASELRPHPLNPRLHGDAQRYILRGLLDEIGLARSVLAHVADADRGQDDPPLTLIDGHLRRDELGDAVVHVEVLDVDDAEAKALLLSLDPLARLADYEGDVLAELRSVVEQDSRAVADLWAALDASEALARDAPGQAAGEGLRKAEPPLTEAFYVLVECRDEAEQVRLLARFQEEGLTCSAKIA